MNIIIAGGGRFGCKAAEELKKIAKKIIVVDVDPNCPASKIDGIDFVIDDASHYIIELMIKGIIPDFIVPCMPGNLAAKIFVNFLSRHGFKVEKDVEGFKNALSKIEKDIIIIAEDATIVASHSKGFICPSNCRPSKICPISNKIILPLYSILNIGENGKIFISKLLAEGVGGISGIELYKELKSRVKANQSFYVGTACECHGIITFLRVD